MGFNLGEAFNNFADFAVDKFQQSNIGQAYNYTANVGNQNQTQPPPQTPQPSPEETMSPEQKELYRMRNVVNKGRGDDAQNQVFKEENEDLFKVRGIKGMISRDGATPSPQINQTNFERPASPSVNPVSNRADQGLGDLFKRLYGDVSSRGLF
jgi:hypothetical protein